jgi:hypothetical protein
MFLFIKYSMDMWTLILPHFWSKITIQNNLVFSLFYCIIDKIVKKITSHIDTINLL